MSEDNSRTPDQEPEHAMNDPNLADDRAWLQAFGQQLKAQQPSHPDGWEAFNQHLTETQAHNKSNAPDSQSTQTKAALEPNHEQPQQAAANDRYWKPLAIAACLAVLIQSVMWLTMPAQPNLGEGYTTASGEPVLAATSQRLIQVQFAPDARLADIQSLLLNINGQLVAGPSAMGLYQLSVTTATAKTALQQLQHSSWIDHAAFADD